MESETRNLISRQLSKNLSQLLVQLKSEHELEILGGFSPLADEPVWWTEFGAEMELAMVHMHEDFSLSYHPVELELASKWEGQITLTEDLLEKSVVPDAILIPGLGYTRGRERLGRGRGCFDRFLSGYSGIKIGVFFSDLEVADVFSQSHDQKLDYIVTEKEIF